MIPQPRTAVSSKEASHQETPLQIGQVVCDRAFVPGEAVAWHLGQVQLARADLEGPRQHGVGPVLPLQPVPGRGDSQQVARSQARARIASCMARGP